MIPTLNFVIDIMTQFLLTTHFQNPENAAQERNIIYFTANSHIERT